MLPEEISYKPFLVAWNLTRQCNLRCGHCYIDAGENLSLSPSFPGSRLGTNCQVPAWEPTELGGSTELTREEGFSLIDDIASVNPDTILVLTGGEPLLYKYTLDFAGYASKKGLMVVVGTNGILLDDPMVKRLMDSGVSGVGVSLDSLDPSKHDTFRGYAGAWKRAMEAIERCRRHGLPFQIHNSVMSFNWRDVPQMVEFAHLHGARVVNFFFMVCTGRGEKLTDITPQQYEEVLSTLIDLQERYPGMLIRARCAPHFKRIAYQKNPHSPVTKAEGYMGGGCLAGTHYCRIAPDGEVTPCPYMPLSVGNIRHDRFSRIWEDATVFRDMRSPQLKGKCGECEYQELCGGCRARPYAGHGDYLGEDLWCQYIPEGGKKIGAAKMDDEIKMIWTEEAEERLKRLPFFLRNMIKENVGKYAKEHGISEITPELLDELRRRRFGDSFPEMPVEGGAAGFNLKPKPEVPEQFDAIPEFIKDIFKKVGEEFAKTETTGEVGLKVEWTEEAWDRLQKAPDFIRSGIKKAAERRAMRMGVSLITSGLLTQFRDIAMMKAVKRIKALGFSELTFDAFDYAKENFKKVRDNREAQERLDEIKEYVTSKGKIGLIDEEMLKKMKEYLSNRK